MEIDQQDYDRIAQQIHSNDSPVGIDAKKTHVLIIHHLEQLQQRLDQIEKRMDEVDGK